jgi:hypothetical protein
MAEQEFRYDVAFSFLGEDEGKAREIAKQLKILGLNVFIYSDTERQTEIAGKDGDVVFGKYFSELSRLVVILYKGGYGKNGPTMVEDQAIRGRRLREGDQFIFCISLDKTAPNYWPDYRIWWDYERFGVKGAVSAITVRVKELDGEPKPLTPKEKADQLKKQRKFEDALEQYFNSREATEDFKKEIRKIAELVKKKEKEVF